MKKIEPIQKSIPLKMFVTMNFQCHYNKIESERNGINIDLIYFYINCFEFRFDQLSWLEID